LHLLTEYHQAPAIRATQWLNTNHPLSLRECRGRVILLDFWDYTCINCLHTLPYLKIWHERYASFGLLILGIHTPEFDFAKSESRVEKAVRRLNIPYPVALDSHSETWMAYGNRYWPSKYLIDPEGRVRAFHVGEGAYGEMETEIQNLLSPLHPEVSWPSPLPPLTPLDDPLAFCERPTQEQYFGYARGVFGNPQKLLQDQKIHYTHPPELTPEKVYLSGLWKHHPQSSEHLGNEPASITLIYRAASVNLVISPGESPHTLLRVFLDENPLPESFWGEDIETDDQGFPCISVEEPRMYQLLKTPVFETHRLTLASHTPGFKLYSLTFVSCPSKEAALT
jgi:thiol-disulfide isomerase/thioredoxin